MRRILRFLYFFGLGITLFGGTLALVVLATRVWHPGPGAAQLEVRIFGIYFIGGAWVAGQAWPTSSENSCRCRAADAGGQLVPYR